MRSSEKRRPRLASFLSPSPFFFFFFRSFASSIDHSSRREEKEARAREIKWVRGAMHFSRAAEWHVGQSSVNRSPETFERRKVISPRGSTGEKRAIEKWLKVA